MCSSLTTDDLADAGIAGHQYQLRRAGRDDPIERGEQNLDLALSSVQSLGNQQSIRRVVFAERKIIDAVLGLPLRQTPPEIAFYAGRCLVALLCRLGEQPHDDRGHRRREVAATRSAGGTGCRAMWQCTHSIGSRRGKRQRAGQHFVEGDAERVEIAARIDRAVHPAGLFRRHVGQRARDHLGRLRRLALAPQARRDAKPGQPDPARRLVDHDVTRRQVFVDDAAAVQCAERRGQTDAEPQEQPELHRLRAQSSRQQLAAGVVEHEARAALVVDERERPNGPRRIQIEAERVLVFEHLKTLGARVLRPRHDDKNGGGMPAGRCSGAAAQDERTILANGFEHILGQVDPGRRMAGSHQRLTSAFGNARAAVGVHLVRLNWTPNCRGSPGRPAIAGGGTLLVPVM